MGKKVSLKYITTKLRSLWCKKGDLSVIDLNEDFFVVHFKDMADYHFVLFEGPWLIIDHYLLVQRRCPLFRPNEYDVQKLSAWIRLPDLPLELCNDKYLWQLGSSLGTMLKVDGHTSIQFCWKFVRIYVELDLFY
jgi:hypothetical protein